MNRGEKDRMLVIAHRGSSGSAPENTMAAFRMAVAMGADMIEFDVRMTRDGELVVHHDRTLGRTSDGRGRLRERSLQELQSVDAGSWFSRKYAGERIPTLREVFQDIPPSIGLNIEVKTDGDTRRQRILGDSLQDAIREARREDSVWVSSFDRRFLRRLHALNPELRLGMLFLPIRDGLRSPSRLVHHTGAGVFVCSRRQLRKRHLRDARAHHVMVAVYGVNTVAELAPLRAAEVEAVITDYPDRILHALRRS